MKRLILACTLAAGCGRALAAADCPPYVKGTPGGDYTSAQDREGLSVVEKFHFSRAVETLTQGMTGSLGADIGYTLEHYPNHHRALASMAKLGLRLKSAQPPGARYGQLLLRAGHRLRAAGRDGAHGVRQLPAGHGPGRPALEQLDAASRMAPDQATIQYNLGLMYVKKKEYEKASAHAQKAYALGFPCRG
jgi:tetratricopeptide (TPR) repeat protein